MAGHIVLVSCLLAICLPIICVQSTRFDNVEEAHAENKAETRSAILRRGPLSPQAEELRRNSRSQTEADIDTIRTETSQKQGNLEEVTKPAVARKEPIRALESMIQGHACAKGEASSRKEPGTQVVRADRKPWDPPFRRQPPTSQPVRSSPGERDHAAKDASPPHTAGRDLAARGISMGVFSTDPISEINLVNEYDRPWSRPLAPFQPQATLHRRLAQEKQMQAFDNKSQTQRREYQPKQSVARDVPSHFTEIESLPSPFDGSPPPSAYHEPRNVPLTKTRKGSCCHHSHWRHVSSDASRPLSPSNSLAAPNEASNAVPREAPKPATVETAEDDMKQIEKEATRAASKHGPIPWRPLLIVMGLIIFIFAFAILVAHCLAWFLVYKTEARLGEVRSGLLRGGEMRLCLCGKG